MREYVRHTPETSQSIHTFLERVSDTLQGLKDKNKNTEQIEPLTNILESAISSLTLCKKIVLDLENIPSNPHTNSLLEQLKTQIANFSKELQSSYPPDAQLDQNSITKIQNTVESFGLLAQHLQQELEFIQRSHLSHE